MKNDNVQVSKILASAEKFFKNLARIFNNIYNYTCFLLSLFGKSKI